MNGIKDIRDKLRISNKDLCTCLNIKPSKLDSWIRSNILIIDIELSYIIALHNYTRLPYNNLIGENVFTNDNINNNIIQIKSRIDNNNIDSVQAEINRLLDALKK